MKKAAQRRPRVSSKLKGVGSNYTLGLQRQFPLDAVNRGHANLS